MGRIKEWTGNHFRFFQKNIIILLFFAFSLLNLFCPAQYRRAASPMKKKKKQMNIVHLIFNLFLIFTSSTPFPFNFFFGLDRQTNWRSLRYNANLKSLIGGYFRPVSRRMRIIDPVAQLWWRSGKEWNKKRLERQKDWWSLFIRLMF